jgi:putative NIF3 family GTP cyclohydrolase 1 type 2
VGKKGKRHHENEVRIEVVLPEFKVDEVLNSMKEAHPYEQIAYDIYTLSNIHPETGSGMIGLLPEPMEQVKFLDHVKKALNSTHVKFSKNGPAKVQKIAVCGGSGAFLISAAKSANADVFLSGDITYHSYFDADESFMIVDVGHFESEQYTSEGIMLYLKEKLPNFATLLTKVNTNPVNTR